MRLFLIIWVQLTVFVQSAPVQHEIVFKNGKSRVGRVAEVGNDSLVFQPMSLATQITIPIDEILYVHNNQGKLFYVSQRLQDFIEKGVGRGGTILTTDGSTISYTNLGNELYMYNARLAYTRVDSQEKSYMELGDIHKIVLDRSLSEYAVRKGFYVGTGLTAIRFLLKFKKLKQFLIFSKLFDSVFDVYPGAVTLTPLITLGWVAYDFMKGDRELVIHGATEGL